MVSRAQLCLTGTVHVVHICDMKTLTLPEWMKACGLKDEDVGTLVGRTRTSISRLRRGLVTPDYDLMQRFREVSDGKVDFPTWAKIKKQSAAREAA